MCSTDLPLLLFCLVFYIYVPTYSYLVLTNTRQCWVEPGSVRGSVQFLVWQVRGLVFRRKQEVRQVRGSVFGGAEGSRFGILRFNPILIKGQVKGNWMNVESELKKNNILDDKVKTKVHEGKTTYLSCLDYGPPLYILLVLIYIVCILNISIHLKK